VEETTLSKYWKAFCIRVFNVPKTSLGVNGLTRQFRLCRVIASTFKRDGFDRMRFERSSYTTDAAPTAPLKVGWVEGGWGLLLDTKVRNMPYCRLSGFCPSNSKSNQKTFSFPKLFLPAQLSSDFFTGLGEGERGGRAGRESGEVLLVYMHHLEKYVCENIAMMLFLYFVVVVCSFF